MALPLLSMVLAQPWWMPHCGSGLLPQHNTELLEALRLPPLKLVRRVAELSLYHSRSCQLTASLQGLAELSKLGCCTLLSAGLCQKQPTNWLEKVYRS